jgi:hypothetical protein
MAVREKRQDCICGLGRNREELTSIREPVGISRADRNGADAKKGTRQEITRERQFGDAQAAGPAGEREFVCRQNNPATEASRIGI